MGTFLRHHIFQCITELEFMLELYSSRDCQLRALFQVDCPPVASNGGHGVVLGVRHDPVHSGTGRPSVAAAL